MERRLTGILIGYCAIAFAVVMSFPANAQSPAITSGLKWIQAQVQSDGSLTNETTSIATSLQARSEAAITLNDIATAPSPLLDAVYSDPGTETESLSRRLIAAKEAGQGDSQIIQAMHDAQNADGGFGSMSGDNSDPLDSAFVLAALGRSGITDTQLIPGLVNYLLGTQQANGQWVLFGDESDLYQTVEVSRALWFYRRNYIQIPGALSRSKNWLMSVRQADGSWDDDALTSMTLDYLLPTLQDTSSVSESLNLLMAHQLIDGSWQDDPYRTALALRALSVATDSNRNPDLANLQGQIVDGIAGAPLAGISVVISGPENLTLVTGSDGSFSVTGLEAGAYSIAITNSGYAPINSIVTLTQGAEFDLGQIALLQQTDSGAGLIQGTISDATTGQPLSGALISIVGSSQSAVTDVNGRYVIYGVTSGAVVLSAQKDGYVTVLAQGTVSAGTVIIFSADLKPGGSGAFSLTGHVTDLATGAPVVGAVVSVGGSENATATTDSAGAYSIGALPEGTYSFSAVAQGYAEYDATITGAGASSLDVSPVLSGTSTPGSLPSALQGVVLSADTNSGVGGATVLLTLDGRQFSVTTGTDGKFSIGQLAGGTGTLQISANGFVTSETEISLPADATLDMGNIQLQKVTTPLPAVVGFTIVDSLSNAPLAGVSVTASFNGSTVNATSDGEGRVSIDAV